MKGATVPVKRVKSDSKVKSTSFKTATSLSSCIIKVRLLIYMDIFVTCGEGIEPLLKDELIQLGYENIHPGFRGVYVNEVDLNAIYHINYCSRLAVRVLLPIAKFRRFDQRDLYKGISTVDWFKYLPKGKTFSIDANVSHRNIRNSLFAAQVAKDAICDQDRERTGNRPNVSTKNPDVQLNLFINGDKAILSFDTSGVPLFKRGYRLEGAKLPYRKLWQLLCLP